MFVFAEISSLHKALKRPQKVNKKSKCSNNPYSPYLQDFFEVISLT